MNLCISRLYVVQYSGDKLENEMGGECGMCGGEERNTCRVWLENLKETNHLGRPRHRFGGGGGGGWELLKWTFKK